MPPGQRERGDALNKVTNLSKTLLVRSRESLPAKPRVRRSLVSLYPGAQDTDKTFGSVGPARSRDTGPQRLILASARQRQDVTKGRDLEEFELIKGVPH